MEKKRKRCAHEEKNERKTIPLHKQVPMSAMNMNVRMVECCLAYAKPGSKIEIPALYIYKVEKMAQRTGGSRMATDRKNRMRVLIVNTSERIGGAALAANHLMDALNNNGVKATMLVRDKQTSDITVATLPHSWRNRLRFLWERWCVFCHLHFSRTHLFEVDIANTGADITALPEFKSADIIHLSWINQGMLSLKSIRKILRSGKPVVWTMHDIWLATGICHVTLDCTHFHTSCGKCRLLPHGGSRHDLSYRVFKRKKKLLHDAPISIVTCSQWLADEARKSGILAHQTIQAIPNPIDTHVFRPGNQQQARARMRLPQDKKIILFAAQRVSNPNKGFFYLCDACHKLAAEHPEMLQTTAIAVMGDARGKLADIFDFEIYNLGYLSDTRQLVACYNAADVFVLPSLSENLPNTIMEAMACGVPCVGFDVGGIPEEIDHRQNGYVAQYRSVDDLARGLRWVLCEADYDQLRREALHKVAMHYSQQAVAKQYIEVYRQALTHKNPYL